MKTLKILLGLLLCITLLSNIASASLVNDLHRTSDNIDEIAQSVDEIEQCFESMNKSMQNTMNSLMILFFSTKGTLESQVIEMNRHLSDLKTSVANFSSSTQNIKKSFKEFEQFKDMAIIFILAAIGIAVLFVVMFVVAMFVIVKKMNQGENYARYFD